jgi:diguanylate cyclase (GGDEF)-like protein
MRLMGKGVRGFIANMARFDLDPSAPRRLVRSVVHDRALPVPARIWLFTGALVVTSVAIYLAQLHARPTPPVTLALPWPVIAAAFALAELKVVQVHFRRETHSFSLSEFPAVIGFFFLSPTDYLIAVFVGSTIAFMIGRPPMIKLGFNLANFMLVAVVELTVLYAVAEMTGAPHVRDWIAAFLATLAAAVLSAVTIATVITLSGGAPQYEKLPEMIQFGSMVAFANTSLALLAVSILWLDPVLLWLLALPLIIVFLAYQAYVSEREKHERLELLYQSSRILQHSPELDSTLVALLGHARTMFRAELAEVVLYPRGTDVAALRTTSRHDSEPEVMIPILDLRGDALHDAVVQARGPFFLHSTESAAHGQSDMVSPLRGESDLIGSFRIANRLTEGTTFTDDDLRLLETLANQAAVALENGHLEQSLAELSRLKEELRFQAYHDPLTGLANRMLFLERAEEQLDRVGHDGMPVLLFLDLDDFKIVNDTMGHAVGDRLLIDVADRLRDVLRPGDVAARLGGDEFAVLLDDGPELQQAVSVADRMIDALRAPFLIQGQEITVGASIGVAAARTGTEAAHELLRNADVAMYKAKGSGKNRVSVFEPTMHAAIVARHALSAELSRSLGRGELVVFFQPIVTIRGLVVTGFEALVRWRHPTRGLINPAEFIPLAEETGVITSLGRYVLEEACRQAARWGPHADSDRPLTVAVNLSAQQLQETDFVDVLRGIIEATGIEPSQLVLEMTETVMFHETATTLARLDAIRSLGVQVAIDDFGTGYSSLGYLRRFRVDILKIAREFVAPADHSDEWAFASAIVALGRTLGLTIVAEGIESNGQLERLRALGCELGQGYLFGRPSDSDATYKFLEDGGARRRLRVIDPGATADPAPDDHPFVVGQASA